MVEKVDLHCPRTVRHFCIDKELGVGNPNWNIIIYDTMVLVTISLGEVNATYANPSSIFCIKTCTIFAVKEFSGVRLKTFHQTYCGWNMLCTMSLHQYILHLQPFPSWVKLFSYWKDYSVITTSNGKLTSNLQTNMWHLTSVRWASTGQQTVRLDSHTK